MLTKAEIERYDRDGFLVVPNVLSAAEVDSLRKATEELVEKSRAVSDHNEAYDLEPGHSAAIPKVRRLKTPDKFHPAFAPLPTHPKIIVCLQAL
jgi:hypothetical protein